MSIAAPTPDSALEDESVYGYSVVRNDSGTMLVDGEDVVVTLPVGATHAECHAAAVGHDKGKEDGRRLGRLEAQRDMRRALGLEG